VVQALLAKPARLYVAIAVEYGERLTMFEHSGTIVSQRGSRQDIVLIFHANDIF
jgi:hypothetical protein